MINVSLKLVGLDNFLADTSSERLSKQTKIGVNKFRLKLTSAISESIVNTYNVSSSEVNRTLLGKSASNVTQGKNTIRAGISYKYRAKSLTEFPFRVFSVQAKSRFRIGKKIIKQSSSLAVAVAVRRGKYKTIVGNGYGGYYQKAGRSKWASIQGGKESSFKSGIYQRRQEATWIDEPIVRAPVKRLYGKSVTQMVLTVLEYDSKVNNVLESFPDYVGKEVF